MLNTDHQDLILKIYDAAADQSLWPDVLDECAWLVNAKSCAIFDYNETSDTEKFVLTYLSASSPLGEIMGAINYSYDQEVKDRALAKNFLSKLDHIELMSDEGIYTDYDEFLARDNIKYLREIGMRHRAIAFLNKDNLDLAQFTIQFPDNRGPAAADEIKALNMLLPHVAKAIDLSQPAKQLMTQSQQLIAAMDHLTIGICILDGNGRVVTQNAEFSAQMEQYDVFSQTPDGVLKFKCADKQHFFSKLRDDASQHGVFGARPRKEAVSTSNGDYLSLELTPLRSSQEIGTKNLDGSVLYSLDTSKAFKCNTHLARQVFDLSETELELLDALCTGMKNAQIAEMRSRAVTTINAQVKSILAKTNCSNRTQLVRLMMSFGASYLR